LKIVLIAVAGKPCCWLQPGNFVDHSCHWNAGYFADCQLSPGCLNFAGIDPGSVYLYFARLVYSLDHFCLVGHFCLFYRPYFYRLCFYPDSFAVVALINFLLTHDFFLRPT
jgi:hypothetical protein